MLDLSRLNDHSRQFATRLYRLWPQWYQFSRYDPYEEFEKEALLVEVPRPVDGSSHGLFVTTSEWEISVGFGENFHTRFGHNGEGQPGDFYSEALAFLQNFVAERVVIAVAYQADEWLGAWSLDLATESLADLKVAAGERVTIRSWQGRYDREIFGG